MHYFKLMFAFMFALVLGAPAMAQDQNMIVMTGSKAGTYYQLMDQAVKECPSFGINVVESGGTMDNLTALLGNKAHMGVVQSDVLFLRSQTDAAYKRILTLMPLHPEEVHIIALSGAKEEGGWGFGNFKIGQNRVILQSTDNLQGRAVGAWGGSLATADVMNYVGHVGMTIKQYKNETDALAALNQGDIDAIIAVGGQPLSWVTKLGKAYKLLDVSQNTSRSLANIYKEAKLDYPNMATVPTPSISEDALLVTRDFKSSKIVGQMMGFKKCVADGIDDLRDTIGNHPKWAVINPLAESKWPMFQPSTK